MVDPESDEDVYDDKLLSGSDKDDVMVDSEDEENSEKENENEQRRPSDEETGSEQGEKKNKR